LDYFLIQLALTLYPGHYFINQLFHRFDLLSSLKEHRFVNADYFNPMLDEALK